MHEALTFSEYIEANNFANRNDIFKNAGLDDFAIANRNVWQTLDRVQAPYVLSMYSVAQEIFKEFSPGFQPHFYIEGVYSEFGDPWSYPVDTAEEYIAVLLSSYLETDEAEVDQDHPDFAANFRKYQDLLSAVGIEPSQYERVMGRILFAE